MAGTSQELKDVTIAFDVMGSDHGPEEVVRGAAQLSLEAPNIHALLVGDRELIDAALADTKHRAERISVQHAPDFVGMDEKPGEALARKKNASVAVAAQLVAEGEAHALVSAGNTGAGVLACARHFQLIPGVRRAALAAVYPTRGTRGAKEDPFSLILDVGATVEANAEDLVAFAVMGSAYARIVSRNDRPKVALLSNGVEPQKGPPRVVEAHTRLASMPAVNFVGNVCLKMLEGVHETVMDLARYAYKEKLRWRAGLAMLSSGIQRIKDITDWEQYGGAPILGFDRIFIKAHGRSKARAITNAGKVAAKAVAHQLGTAIQEGLAR